MPVMPVAPPGQAGRLTAANTERTRVPGFCQGPSPRLPLATRQVRGGFGPRNDAIVAGRFCGGGTRADRPQAARTDAPAVMMVTVTVARVCNQRMRYETGRRRSRRKIALRRRDRRHQARVQTVAKGAGGEGRADWRRAGPSDWEYIDRDHHDRAYY